MRWEAQFFGNRWAEVFLATCCWAGTVRGIGPPTLSSLRPQSPYSGVHLKVSNIFFAVSYSFIYPCWTGTAYCSLLTWAETKWVRQLIIHGAIISSFNTVITGLVGTFSLVQFGSVAQLCLTLLSQIQIPIARKIPQKEIVATLRTLQLILWYPVGSECFSEDCEIFFNLSGTIYLETTSLIQDG